MFFYMCICAVNSVRHSVIYFCIPRGSNYLTYDTNFSSPSLAFPEKALNPLRRMSLTR